jgi:hypothetical protein
MSKVFVLILLVSPVLVASGCGDGGAAVAQRRSNLHEVGLAYLRFASDQRRSPTDASELAEFMRSELADEPRVQEAIVRLEEGDVVVIWNGDLGDASANARYVLGFEAGVPATGGYVVMGDGVIRLMTSKDYSQATVLPTLAAKQRPAEEAALPES